jgi:hypothetical protein
MLPPLMAWKPGKEFFDFVTPLVDVRRIADERAVPRYTEPSAGEVPPSGLPVLVNCTNAAFARSGAQRFATGLFVGIVVDFRHAHKKPSP